MYSICVEGLQGAIKTMQEQNDYIKSFCTNECEECPLKDMCDWEGNIEFLNEGITDSVLEKFVEYQEKVEYENERKTFKEVTGIDPAWYDFNNDRTESDY